MRPPTLARTVVACLYILSQSAHGADVDRGRFLAEVARCESCHTVDDALPYGGGYAIETTFGTFYGTNLTPSPTGIGAWTLADFQRAMQHGRSPEGTPYYPAFPYPSFSKMSDADLADLFAYLKTLPAAPVENRPHEVRAPYRGLWKMRLWKWVAFTRRPIDPEERGAYWVDAVAHCGECHSGRGPLGKTRRAHYLAGSDAPPEPAPNITPAALSWTRGDWTSFLSDGMTPEGDVVGGEMRGVILDGTATLTEDDRRAMADYLLDVKPRPRRTGKTSETPAEEEEPWM
jgi:cytochrome c553